MRLKERLSYEAEAQWDKETGGEVTSNGFKVGFDTPSEYGGNERHPCPDQLFLASITGCLMNTFLYYRSHLGAETEDIKITAEAEIELVNPIGYRIKGIDAHIQVWSSEEEADLNRTCAERARDYCHLTKSIDDAIPLKVQVTVHRNQ
ncbi:OsmC family protein [Candidatus Bathyarchaeota archaeon]|jgi:organic hydroperoxide reductase OsmC/OhrA|nr:OsmC family protein [Candidatus Bathyarchaeota archaeon]MBT4319354.1 OsmC family protein [Candidatus Bathyarchaeota archaeon]MBT4424867.1 OsmC family protein [Candidatus Bathyarchaeota archaeon]MBT6604450.1 OsmC family protein [Candidatus Bathyarchaeota archaeon]MBT7186589.1 OsmC family protein [Candidatus Bathyarchaeota archaeon]